MTRPQAAVLTLQPPRLVIGDDAFRVLAQRLEDETGIVLSDAKRGLAVSRLTRRLRALGLPDFDAYCSVLEGPNRDAEVQEMILLLTTNVTRFFREPHHFDILREDVLPALMTKATAGGRVRIWSAGCSSGEEPFSIAMSVLDVNAHAADLDIQILATDIDSNVLKAAESATYKLNDDDFKEHPLLSRFLKETPLKPKHYQVAEKARSMVRFARLNLMDSWPMRGQFDVIFCRNVVIYFSAETQQGLWPRFANALTAGGHLMIGHSERVIGPATDNLRSVGVTHYELKARRVTT